MSIVISKLRGRALKAFNEGMGLISDITYEEVRQHLLNTYRTRESQAERLERFFKMVQRPEESVEAFYFRLRGLASKLNYSQVLMGDILRERFVEGLRTDIARHVMLGQPRTLEDAIERAKEMELIDLRISRKTKKVNSIVEVSQVNMNDWDELKSQMYQLKKDMGELINGFVINHKRE